MSRHFCNHNEDSFLCVAESRGDFRCCAECPLNEDAKYTNEGGKKWIK